MGANTIWHEGQRYYFGDAVAEPRVQQWEILLKARAVENQAFVDVSLVHKATDPDDVFSGHYLVLDPLGKCSLAG